MELNAVDEEAEIDLTIQRNQQDVLFSHTSTDSEPLVEELPKSSMSTMRKLLNCLAVIVILPLLLTTGLVVHYEEESSGINRIFPENNHSDYNVSEKMKDICTTPECIRSAASLLESMNTSVNPCDDFYKFTCGGWPEEHPIPSNSLINNWFLEKTSMQFERVREFLERNNSADDSTSTRRARTMFKACMDTDKLEELGVEPLNIRLELGGLSLIPPLNESDYRRHSKYLDMNSMLAHVKTDIGVDILLYVSVSPSPLDRRRNLITIFPPNVIVNLPGSDNNDYCNTRNYFQTENSLKMELASEKSNLYKRRERYFSDIVNYFARETNRFDISVEAVAHITATLLKLYTDIQKVTCDSSLTTFDLSQPTIMDLQQLQDVTDKAAEETPTPLFKINWRTHLEATFGFTSLNLDWRKVLLAVYSLDYYRELSKVLANYSHYEIMLYIWSEAVFALIPYSNAQLRSMRSDLLYPFGEPAPLVRGTYCAVIVQKVMNSVVGAGLITGVNMKNTAAGVNKMVDNIEDSLKDSIDKADWIDSETKTAIIDKAKNIKRYIGYPYKLLDSSVDEYRWLKVKEDQHMENFVFYAKFMTRALLLRVDKENTNRDVTSFDPTIVNAYYHPEKNSIIIPLGILQYPFYDLGLDALNYGSIGVIIGHELTHAFDIKGRWFNKNGIIHEWWTNETTKNYLDRVKCFIEHYNSYYVEAAEKSVDGSRTLSENIADNGGLKEAYNAFQKLKKGKDYKKLKLVGLEEYSDDQLFFLGFGHTWCAKWTARGMKMYLNRDIHSPNFARNLGMVSNSKEFAKTWNCPVGSKMNPDKKCQLW